MKKPKRLMRIKEDTKPKGPGPAAAVTRLHSEGDVRAAGDVQRPSRGPKASVRPQAEANLTASDAGPGPGPGCRPGFRVPRRYTRFNIGPGPGCPPGLTRNSGTVSIDSECSRYRAGVRVHTSLSLQHRCSRYRAGVGTGTVSGFPGSRPREVHKCMHGKET